VGADARPAEGGVSVRPTGRPADTARQAGSRGTLPRPEIHASARNHFPAKITKIQVLGPIAKVNLDCGFPLVATITHRSVLDLDLKVGQKVVASFKATALHIIKHDADKIERTFPPPEAGG
ncbi:MAG: TOBE domain-containing protein, partial [Actinomycetota bacterium]